MSVLTGAIIAIICVVVLVGLDILISKLRRRKIKRLHR